MPSYKELESRWMSQRKEALELKDSTEFKELADMRETLAKLKIDLEADVDGNPGENGHSRNTSLLDMIRREYGWSREEEKGLWLKRFEFLCKLGCNVNQFDMVGYNQLIWATYGGDLRLINILLKYDADPELGNAFTPPNSAMQAVQYKCNSELFSKIREVEQKIERTWSKPEKDNLKEELKKLEGDQKKYEEIFELFNENHSARVLRKAREVVRYYQDSGLNEWPTSKSTPLDKCTNLMANAFDHIKLSGNGNFSLAMDVMEKARKLWDSDHSDHSDRQAQKGDAKSKV